MSDVIEFLERMGHDAQLSRATKDSLDFSLMLAGLDPALQATICGGDRVKLGAFMGAAPACGFLAPGEEQDEDDSEETPSPDNDEERSVSDLAN